MTRRVDRLNSLLRTVISDVIVKHVKNPKLPKLVTITRVSITPDLHQAKVYVSVIGDEKTKVEALKALKSSAGFIGHLASKEVKIRYFPELTFYLDETVDKQMHIEGLLQKIHDEEEKRQ